MKKQTLWILIVIVVLILIGWWGYSSMKTGEVPLPEENSEVMGANEEQFVDDSKDSAVDTSASTAGDTVTVKYTASGFSPKTVTVKKGTKVTFVNESGASMWVGADEHPTHTSYDGTSKSEHCASGTPSATSFDQCSSGASYTFTFTKIGTWGYHNHASAGNKGVVVVTE